MKYLRGFTLIEMMIVLVIAAILTTVALPVYQGHLSTIRRGIAMAELYTVMGRQEQYFINNRGYAESLDLLAYSSSPYAINQLGDEVDINSPERVYLISIKDVKKTDETVIGFIVQAIPQLDQMKDKRCGVIGISSRGVKTVSAGAVGDCW